MSCDVDTFQRIANHTRVYSCSMTFGSSLFYSVTKTFKRCFSLNTIPISTSENQTIRKTINSFVGIQTQTINRSYSSDKGSDFDKKNIE